MVRSGDLPDLFKSSFKLWGSVTVARWAHNPEDQFESGDRNDRGGHFPSFFSYGKQSLGSALFLGLTNF